MERGPPSGAADAPQHLDLDRAAGLTVRWRDGHISFYPIAHLRRMSPSADSRQLRSDLASNPLTVLPNRPATTEPLRAIDAELVGNYALRIRFSDGHATGLFTWDYLRAIEPPPAAGRSA